MTPNDILERLYLQQDRTSALQERLSADQRRLIHLLTPLSAPPEAHVLFHTDEHGLLVDVTLERHSGATPDGIRSAFADAAMKTWAVRSSMSSDELHLLLTDETQIDEYVETVWDDLRQVGVSALFGNVTAVVGRDTWLTQAPLQVVCDEVLRLGLLAVRRSDRLGRCTSTKRGVHE